MGPPPSSASSEVASAEPPAESQAEEGPSSASSSPLSLRKLKLSSSSKGDESNITNSSNTILRNSSRPEAAAAGRGSGTTGDASLWRRARRRARRLQGKGNDVFGGGDGGGEAAPLSSSASSSSPPKSPPATAATAATTFLLRNKGSPSRRRRRTSGRGSRELRLLPTVPLQLSTMTTMVPAGGGIAKDMSSVLQADDDWDRHQRIQGALQRQNFTLHKLRVRVVPSSTADGTGQQGGHDELLFGRVSERQALLDAFRATLANARANATASPSDSDPTTPVGPGVSLVSVAGRAGTGKTRLCESIRGDVLACGGFFLRGKFEWRQRQQSSRSEPLAAIGAALSDLHGQLEACGGAALADAVRTSLREALEEDGARALAAAIPGLARLLLATGEEGIKPAPSDAPPPRGNDDDDAARAGYMEGKGPPDPGHPDDPATPRTTTKTTNPTVAQDVEEAAAETEELLTTRSPRLQYVFQQLFRCVCRLGHPVVLFLDDVQWSDDDGGATLALLSAIFADPALSGLMVLAACREEVDDEHPWSVLVRDLRDHHASRVALHQVALSDLDRSAVRGMVRAALSCGDDDDNDRTARLAEIVHSKTSGNAMHVVQFLSGLYDDGLLRYNVGFMGWVWDERAVQARPVTDNVVDLTTAKLRKLPPQLRAVLMVAACLCRTFDAATLELVLGRVGGMDLLGSSMLAAAAVSSSLSFSAPTVVDGEDAAANSVGNELPRCEAPPGLVGEATSGSPPAAGAPLSPPLVASLAPSSRSEGKGPGLLVADKKEKDEDQYLKAGLLQASLDQLVEDAVIEYNAQLDSYCFAHDMIQEASFCLIPDKVRGPVQRAVGLALLRSHKIKELDDRLYFRAIELSNVIGSGADGGEDYGDGSQFEMTSDLEYATLVQHNNDAGHRAMTKAAFGSALRYFEAGLLRLDNASSGGDGKLFLEMSSGAAEAAFCSGNIAAMERHIAAALKFDAPIENKVRVYLTRISSYGSQGKQALAISTGRQVLTEMGITRLPNHPSTHHMMAELLKTKWVLRNHTEQSLLALPTLEDKRRLQAMSIINMMAAFAYYSDMNLFASFCVMSGSSKQLKFLFSDRLNATSSRSKTISFYALVAPWRTPFRRVIKMVEYGYKLGMKTGELEIAMCNLCYHYYALVATSAMPLKTLITKIRSDSYLMREYGHNGIRNFVLLLTQFVLKMAGPVERPTVMTGEAMCEEHFRSTFVSAEHRLLIGWLNHFRLKLAYYFGDYDRADAFSRITEDFAMVTASHPYVYWHATFSSLTAFAMARKVQDRLCRLRQWRRALRFAKLVKKWSDSGNVNCLHLTQLLEAEKLSFSKSKEAEARRMYSASITNAHKNGYMNDKALAHERAFLFHLHLANADQQPPLSARSDAPLASDGGDDWFWAQHHFKDAVEAYGYWNAFQKVQQLVDTYGGLFRLT